MSDHTDTEAIARIIDPDVFCYHKSMIEAGLKDGLSADEARAQADRCTAHTIPPAVVKAERILSYLASRREAEPEYIYDDVRFNQGVLHVVDMLARNLGVTDWAVGDGSEDYDDDLWQTVLNILAAKGLYDADSGEFASRREAQEPVAWRWRFIDSDYWTVCKTRPKQVDDRDVWCEPLYTVPPAPSGEVERPTPNERFIPRMLLLDDLHAVCVGGRWDGWKFFRHPDGQWVSLKKLEEQGADNAARAALNGGRADE